jgi:hypothetical protein
MGWGTSAGLQLVWPCMIRLVVASSACPLLRRHAAVKATDRGTGGATGTGWDPSAGFVRQLRDLVGQQDGWLGWWRVRQ